MTIILSSSDCWKALKGARWIALLASLSFALLFFVFFLTKPPTYTAKGLFKGNSKPKSSSFTKALELLEDEGSYVASDDPSLFLKSYPVMEEVAQTLHLQLTIDQHTLPNPFKQMWRTLKAEKAQRLAKNKRPSSTILRMPVAKKAILPDLKHPLICTALDYPAEFFSLLTATFTSDTQFEVRLKRQLIGNGELGKPFRWKGGSFTLESTQKMAGKRFSLTFLPLNEVVESLEKSLHVKRSKDHSTVVSVAFTHTDRHLAAAIVNEAMRGFQTFLRSEGERKITEQISYLKQRQSERLADLEQVMKEHCAYLESHLDAGEMLLLENELQFLAQKQAEIRRGLDTIEGEMHQLYHALSGNEFESIEQIRALPLGESGSLTVEGAHARLLEYEKTLDQAQMEQAEYEYCLSKLSEPDFDFSSLSKVVAEPSLIARFERIHALHRNLIDEKNWMEKERAQLAEELETERLFLKKHIQDLKEGAKLNDAVVQERVLSLRQTLLTLLADRYEKGEKSLRALAVKAAHLPQKWFTEQKIELDQRLQTEVIEAISQLIETKNIGYHLDALTASPLKRAIAPLFPDPPHILIATVVGTLFGLLLVFGVLCIYEVWRGPTASYSNLKNEGLPAFKSLDEVVYNLEKSEGKVAVIGSQTPQIKEFEATYLEAAPGSLESRRLIDQSDYVVLCVHGERWSELPPHSNKLLYYCSAHTPKTVSLKEIVPLLERLAARRKIPSGAPLET